jgi:PEP-CTERM motif
MIGKQFATRLYPNGAARRLTGLCGCLTALAVFAIGSHVDASPIIVDSHGFEQPFFTTTAGGTGSIEGQTPATFNGTWLRDKTVGASTAIVQTATVAPGGGTQAVRVNKAANDNAFWAVPVSGYPASGYVCIDWDMLVQGTGLDPNTNSGPFMGVKAYDDDANKLGLLGAWGVDATTGEVLYQAANTREIVAPGPIVALGTWNNFDMELNFFTHTYRFLLNNVQIGPSIGFVDQNNVVGGLNEFTDADIAATVSAAGAAGVQTGTAYFDNFRVEDGPCPVPEPSTIGLAAIGAVGVWLSRHRGQRRLAK